ncbi:uncharacterized protein BKA55DRAFT_563897 [Fusarium redolens]|uniref:Uncharacterized protein n=1 Tax=Fusarium redolens TaxID=48865 RepID=A0A9P9KBS1_FUSRE|nr:uncharacterized protein BKA55DRAFT_563897 [Fusarium redolens]KAH7255358.1 hypothetical protein BKA55DRAFT_563897 [Fusarium redolens]
MRARLGSPSDPMTLPRLQKWAADEMFHLRASLSSGKQCTGANDRTQGSAVKSGGPTPRDQIPAAKAAADQPKGLKMFDIDDLLNGDYTNEVVARITQRDIEIIVGQRAEPHVAWFLRVLLGIRRDHSDFTARRLVRDWVYDIKSRECMKTQAAAEPTKCQAHIGEKLGQDATSKVLVNKKNTTKIEEGPRFIDDNLIAFA